MAKKTERRLNALGKYLEKRSINKSQVCKKTGIHPTRMTWLCYESITFLRASELQLIAMAIKVSPSEMQNELFGDLKLKEGDKILSDQEKLNLRIIELLKSSENIIQKQRSIDTKDSIRIGKILIFCSISRTENEILRFLDFKRKSPKFIAVLKVCVQMDLINLKQTKEDGMLITTYTTTEEGKRIIKIE